MVNRASLGEKQALIDDFLHECRGYQAAALQALKEVHQQLIQGFEAPVTLIHEIFRLIHTIKGTSAYMELIPLKDLSHAMEGVLQSLRDGLLKPDEGRVSLLITGCLELDHLFQALEHDQPLESPGLKNLLTHLEDCARDGKVGFKSAFIWENAASSHHQKTLRLNKEKYSHLMRLIDASENLAEELEEHLMGLDERIVDFKKESGISGSSLKGMLQASSRLELLGASLKSKLNELKVASLVARMQPLKGVLARFGRLAQDLALKQGKCVRVEIQGGELEVDTLICDALGGILTHVIRNALDHGIEPRAERARAGKDETASIQLRAALEDDELLLTVSEDGRGIDDQALVACALARGLIQPDEASRLDLDQKIDLMFAPGITTAPGVSETSGRGVGMDAVRNSVQCLGGDIRVKTHKGRGTDFTLRLPRLLLTEGAGEQKQETGMPPS